MVAGVGLAGPSPSPEYSDDFEADAGESPFAEAQQQPGDETPLPTSAAVPERLAELESLEGPELRALVLEQVKENHQLRNRLGRVELAYANLSKMLAGCRAELSQAQAREAKQQQQEPELRGDGSRVTPEQSVEKVGQLKLAVTNFLSDLGDKSHFANVAEVEPAETEGLRQRVHVEHKRLGKFLEELEERFREKSGKLQLCRQDTARMLDQLTKLSDPAVILDAPLAREGSAAAAAAASAASALEPRPPSSAPALWEGGPKQRRLRCVAVEPKMGITVLLAPGSVLRTASRARLEVRGSETAREVERRLAEAGAAWGGPPGQKYVGSNNEPARLLFGGVPLASDVPLQEQGVEDGSVLRLLPALGGSSTRQPELRSHGSGGDWHKGSPGLGSTPRGLLMNPGSRTWTVALARQPLKTEELFQEEDAGLRRLLMTWPKPPART